MTENTKTLRVTGEGLRWRCPTDGMTFETTAELEPGNEVVAQPTAAEALRFSLNTAAQGQNVYVRGPRGTGRTTMVRRLLDELEPQPLDRPDHCFVNNFAQPDKPRLISLAAGEGRQFRRAITQLATAIGEDLPQALEAEDLAAERLVVEERVRSEIEKLTDPLQAELRKNGLALANVEQGKSTQTIVVPLVDGEPVPPVQFRQLVKEGKVSDERREQFDAVYPKFRQRLQAVGMDTMRLQREGLQQM
ncbi:MAG: Lon-like protease helical domain-containing protein, partial [Pseudomonadota bacterium]